MAKSEPGKQFKPGTRVRLIDDPQRTFIVHQQLGDRCVVIPDDTINDPGTRTFTLLQIEAV